MRWRDKLALFFIFLLSFLLYIILDSLTFKFLIFLISLFLIYLFIYRLERELKQVKYFLSRLKLGDYKIRIFVDRDDYIGEIFSELNEVTRHTEFLCKEKLKKEKEFKAILNLLEAPIVLLDDIGRIVEANKSFSLLFGKDSEKEFKGKWYWEILRGGGFLELFSLVKERGSVDKFKVVLNNRVFLGSGLLLDDGILIYFREITEEVRLKDRESDLILSIAHELKTPLAAIKGAAETLEEEIGESKLLSIVKRNAERLTKIVSDLLTLQEMEGERVRKEVLNLVELVRDVLPLLEGGAKEKGISLTLEVPKEEVFINGDRGLIESALLNLIENAIKYNINGGNVKVIVQGSEKEIKVIVEDTGIGIPKEHIPYIFEKFYVVDRSRSKKLGGVGLGLSIVKEAVSLHGGRVEVESEVGRGSKFTLIFPT